MRSITCDFPYVLVCTLDEDWFLLSYFMTRILYCRSMYDGRQQTDFACCQAFRYIVQFVHSLVNAQSGLCTVWLVRKFIAESALGESKRDWCAAHQLSVQSFNTRCAS